MHRKLLLVVLFVEVLIYVIYNPLPNGRKLIHTININKNVDINKIKLENYVIGVVAAEMPATFSYEALKAQAVVSRTFIYNKIKNGNISYDELVNDKGQAYIDLNEMRIKWGNDFDKYYSIVKKASTDTYGEIIVYKDEPIKAYYFSSSNGQTENASVVFKEEEYLKSVDSHWDKESKEYEKEMAFEINDFKNKLRVEGDSVVVSDIIKSETNHVTSLKINGAEFSGVDFRKKLGLRSTDFDIKIDDQIIKISTRGYGHGVGMSQYGANYMALSGKSYKEIIKYFYNSVDVKKL